MNSDDLAICMLNSGQPMARMTAIHNPRDCNSTEYRESTLFPATVVFEGAAGLFSCPLQHLHWEGPGRSLNIAEYSYFPDSGIFISSVSFRNEPVRIFPLSFYKQFEVTSKNATQIRISIYPEKQHDLYDSLQRAIEPGSHMRAAIRTKCGRTLSLEI